VLDKGDDERLLKMTALLRLAEQLDRSRDGSVRELKLHWGPHSAELEVYSEVDISVALWSANNHTDIFKAAFGKPLEIIHIR
jgi:exopolyphosphatase/guanosine-5'-triphosphate,3'-diphosphate pyrophosphatase